MAKDYESLKKSRERRKEIIEKYGDVPESIWKINYNVFDVIEYEKRKQWQISRGRHKTYNYDKTNREFYYAFKASSNNVRGTNENSGLSTFPPELVKKVVLFYSNENDIVLDPMCIAGDTLISLPEGDIPIKNLVGKEPYVYCSDGKELKLRKAFNIRKTRQNTEVIKIVLDNDSYILCTKEHEFMLLDGSWKMAKDLKENDSLMPIYRKKHKQSGRWIVKTKRNCYKRQSIFLMEQLSGKILDTSKFCVHHKNGDKTNDNINNLEILSQSNHSRQHAVEQKRFLYLQTPSAIEKRRLKSIGTGNNFFGKKHTKESKNKIGNSSKGRNLGKKHKNKTIELMKERHKDKNYIFEIKKLLQENKLSRKEIANLVGVHTNTVGNIARNRFNYNHSIKRIETYSKKIDVYNMEVEEFNNYFANGVCIHNCGHNSRMQATWRLHRHYIGYDISKEFMQFNREVKEKIMSEMNLFQSPTTITLREQSSEKLEEKDNSIDLVFTSPPYWCLEYYGDEKEQLGKCETYLDFLAKLKTIIAECYRVLKKDKFCVFNINDFRYKKVFYPYHSDVIRLFQEVGFTMWDVIIIKWKGAMGQCFASQVEDRKICAKAHEYLVVARK